MNHCLHVKLKVTPRDLNAMGVDRNLFKYLLSGRAFPVETRKRAPDGRTMVLLCHPLWEHDVWVYEEFTEPV